MISIIRIIILSLLITGCTTASTSIKYYGVQDVELMEQEIRRGRMIEVATLDGKNIRMTFKKFDEYTNELHGRENFSLTKIPIDNIDKIKVVTKTYKIDEDDSKEVAKGVGAGILYGIGCLVSGILGGTC